MTLVRPSSAAASAAWSTIGAGQVDAEGGHAGRGARAARHGTAHPAPDVEHELAGRDGVAAEQRLDEVGVVRGGEGGIGPAAPRAVPGVGR